MEVEVFWQSMHQGKKPDGREASREKREIGRTFRHFLHRGFGVSRQVSQRRCLLPRGMSLPQPHWRWVIGTPDRLGLSCTKVTAVTLGGLRDTLDVQKLNTLDVLG